MTTLTDVDWAQANCTSVGRDAFFEDGDPDDVRGKVCARCPIKQACLDYAIDNEEQYGIWGGMTPRQRLKIIRQRYGMRLWRWSQASVTEEWVLKFCQRAHHPIEGRNVFIDHRGKRTCLECREEDLRNKPSRAEIRERRYA
jgi:WhiB family transcriptional regulator, redox-sensing transcriptional regulator